MATMEDTINRINGFPARSTYVLWTNINAKDEEGNPRFDENQKRTAVEAARLHHPTTNKTSISTSLFKYFDTYMRYMIDKPEKAIKYKNEYSIENEPDSNIKLFTIKKQGSPIIEVTKHDFLPSIHRAKITLPKEMEDIKQVNCFCALFKIRAYVTKYHTEVSEELMAIVGEAIQVDRDGILRRMYISPAFPGEILLATT